MKKMPYIMMFALICTFNSQALAEGFDEEAGLNDIFAQEDKAKKEAQENSTRPLGSFISSRIPTTTARNIEKAEKVFCYTIEEVPANYSGYTIHNMAITGSCGELSSDGRELLREMLLNNNPVYSSNMDNCRANPKIMFRYINGIDSTDILLSAPCHSLTFINGRNIQTLNASQGKNIVELIISTYTDLREDFLSPALLDQIVPNGQVITQDQKEIVRRIKKSASPKKWNNDNKQSAPSNNSNNKQTVKGWNKLK